MNGRNMHLEFVCKNCDQAALRIVLCCLRQHHQPHQQHALHANDAGVAHISRYIQTAAAAELATSAAARGGIDRRRVGHLLDSGVKPRRPVDPLLAERRRRIGGGMPPAM